MDILWSNANGQRWEQIDTDDVLVAQDHIVSEFVKDSPECVMTQCAMIIKHKDTEDARCIMSVTFVGMHNSQVIVNVCCVSSTQVVNNELVSVAVDSWVAVGLGNRTFQL
jgi:hypothetical protein